jgi:hypothetical protein
MAYTTIDNPELYFQVKTYTGTGSSHAITLDGDTDMQPDMVWWKERTSTDYPTICDSVRGATKRIFTNVDEVEDTQAESLKSFDSDGFTMGTNAGANQSSQTYVAWCWKEASGIFDCVTYTGNATNRTISHSLSAVPEMIIFKSRSGSHNWSVYHQANGNTHGQFLNTTSAKDDDATYYQDTTPTSSVFSIGTSVLVNDNTETYVAYAFAPKQGFSKFGSYVGNGDADGQFIYTGFRPAFVITKRSETGGDNWHILDNKRDIFNPAKEVISANANTAEGTTSTSFIDFLSNGFKCRGTGASINTDATDYIYMAFAEAPFVNSNGVPCNAR